MFNNNLARRMNPLHVYLILEGVSALLIQSVVTIYVVYYAETVGLDPLQIVLLGTVFETTIFLFEIPTGIVADVYSRRLSVIVGMALTGVGLLVAGLFPLFVGILISEIVTGIGATFLSGATDAWIADEIGEQRAGEAFVRGAQVKMIAGIAGIVVSVALASAALSLPFIAAGALFLALTAFLIAFMPETRFQPAAERANWRALLATVRAGVRLIRVRRLLLVILVIQFIFSFHGEGFDHLWQNFIVDDFTLPSLGTFAPVVWFGIIGLGANLLGIVLSEIVRRRVNLNDHRATARALLVIYALTPPGIIAFSLAGEFSFAVMAFLFVMMLRSAGEPLSKAWLNQNIEPRIRATMFSLNGQVSSLGEIFGGPPIGVVARTFSLRAALAASGMVLVLALPLFGITLRRHEGKSLRKAD